MTKRNAPFYILCAVAVIVLYSSKALAKASSFIVITNIASPIDTISVNELRDIYNGDRVFWTTGKRIRAARLSDESLTNTLFLAKILGKSPSQYVQHWRHKLFSGKGLPPKVIEDSEKMINYVEENEGSIGILPGSMRISNPKLKVIQVSE